MKCLMKAVVFVLVLVGCAQPHKEALDRTNVGNGGNDVVAKFKLQSRSLLERWGHSTAAIEYGARSGLTPQKIEKNLFDERFVVSVSAVPIHDRLGKVVHARQMADELELDGNYWSDLLSNEAEAAPLILHELLRLHPQNVAGKENGMVDDNYQLSTALVALLSSTRLNYPSGMRVAIGSEGCDYSAVTVSLNRSEKMIEIILEGGVPASSLLEKVKSAMSATLNRKICELYFSTGAQEFDGEVPKDFELESFASAETVGALGLIELSLRGTKAKESKYHRELVSVVKGTKIHSVDLFSQVPGSETSYEFAQTFTNRLLIESAASGAKRASLTVRKIQLRFP